MKTRSLAVGLLIGLALGTIATADEDLSSKDLSSPSLTLEELSQEPRIARTLLSPTGDRVAVLMRRQGLGSEPNAPKTMELTWIGSEDDRRGPRVSVRSIDRLWWSTDGEVLFLLAGNRLGRWILSQSRPAWLYLFEDGKEQKPWGVDPSMPRHFLILDEPEPKQTYRLQRLDVDGTLSVVLELQTPIVDVLLDGSREPRFIKTVIRTADLDEPVILERRSDGEREILRCPVLDPCDLLGFDDDTLWIRSRYQGRTFDRDRLQLTAVDLQTLEGRAAHTDPRRLGELRGIVWNAEARRPLLATYETERRDAYGIDPETERHVARLRRDFADSELRVEARSLTTPWLLEERASNLHHPRHYLYDPGSGTRREILSQERASAPMIPSERLATQRPISYTAKDGRRIHGYVWQPEGSTDLADLEDLSQAPMVAWIHGGPWSRIRYGFNPAAQLLVDRGYVVFQPNFRGSSGYGEDHLRAGKGELSRGKVQQDILDGIDFLAGSGIGDRDNVAIMGHSYGGFAALAAAAFHGDRYRAAVATAAPINLIRTFRELDIHHPGRHGLPLSYWTRELLVDLDDPEAVAAERDKSPEMHVGDTSIPVLMVAGAEDDRVSIVDVKHYASRLHEAGRSVGLWIDTDAGHDFETAHMGESVAWLTERFLAEHLGGRKVPPTDPEIDVYLSSRAVLGDVDMAP